MGLGPVDSRGRQRPIYPHRATWAETHGRARGVPSKGSWAESVWQPTRDQATQVLDVQWPRWRRAVPVSLSAIAAKWPGVPEAVEIVEKCCKVLGVSYVA